MIREDQFCMGTENSGWGSGFDFREIDFVCFDWQKLNFALGRSVLHRKNELIGEEQF